MLEQATVEARELGHEYFGCEHVLLAFLRDATTVPARVLAHRGVHFDDFRTEVVRLIHGRPGSGTSSGPSPAV